MTERLCFVGASRRILVLGCVVVVVVEDEGSGMDCRRMGLHKTFDTESATHWPIDIVCSVPRVDSPVDVPSNHQNESESDEWDCLVDQRFEGG